jgi:hypothetical protein
MTYGDHMTRARSAMADALTNPEGEARFDEASRNLVVRSLSGILDRVLDAAPPVKSRGPAEFEAAVVQAPAVVLRDRLAATAAALALPDPSTTFAGRDDDPPAPWETAARALALAADALGADQTWRKSTDQQWAIAKDVADLTVAVTCVERLRGPHPGAELPAIDRLYLAASLTRSTAQSGPLDYGVDLLGRPALATADSVGVAAAVAKQRRVTESLATVPSHRNLLIVVRQQIAVSANASRLLTTGPQDRAVNRYFEQRRQVLAETFRELRLTNGNLGRGKDAVALSTETAAILDSLASAERLAAQSRNQMAALAGACQTVDDRVSGAIVAGLNRGAYLVASTGREEDLRPVWTPKHGVQHARGPIAWSRATETDALPLRALAVRLSDQGALDISPAASAASPMSARAASDTDDLNEALRRAGPGPRPDRPNSPPTRR